jgi:V/A-type H+-transporting ATPase subunit I
MFRSQTMLKVQLVVPNHDIIAVTEALATSGVFHLTQERSVGTASPSVTANQWYEWDTMFEALEQRVLVVMEALDIDEGVPPDTPHLIEPNVAARDVDHLEREAQGPMHKLNAAHRRLERLTRYLSQLEPIANLEVDLGELRNMRYTQMIIGTMPTANIERLESSLEHIPVALAKLHDNGHLGTVVLMGLQRDADILERATRSAYLTPLKPPDSYRGSPEDGIKALNAGIKRTEQHIAEYQAEIEKLHETHIRHLRHLLWRVRASQALVQTINQYEQLRFTYIISGWVPQKAMDGLQTKLHQVSEHIAIESVSPQIDAEHPITESIPVSLDNPPFMKAFQDLVTNYGYPRYGELDPAVLMAFTFPLVFGVMFGDVGHGLLLAMLGILLLSKQIKPLKSMAAMGTVLIACGGAAMIFGFLYGSIFGFEHILHALWLRPLEDIMDILLATVGIGVGLLSLGMGYNILNALLGKNWGKAIFSHHGIVGLGFYWSLLGLAAMMFMPDLPIPSTVIGISTLLFGIGVTFAELLERVVSGHRPLIESDIGTYMMSAFFELFEVLISFLSNTLSYVRMGAFAVAHGALSLVVFIIAETVSPQQGFGYWLSVILGNLFVLGFEGMIVGIQTLRLEYYEFFSKFFAGGGECYCPLSLLPTPDVSQNKAQEIV